MAGVGESVGGYRIVDQLASGFRGARFRAVDTEGASYVLMFVAGETACTAGFRDSLGHAAALLERVSSFSLLTAVDTDPWSDTPWVAFRYVPHAVPLNERLADGGVLTGRELYRFVVHTATALAILHDAGAVHHEFTGENVLVSGEGAIVVDGVVARALAIAVDDREPTLTSRRPVPERWGDGRTTSADNVFAWAATTVRAATGRSAFPGSTFLWVANGVMSEEPDLEGVPEPLSSVLERCLASDPARRPSAHRVLAVLLGYTRDDVRPGLEELHRRASRFGTRKRWMPLEVTPEVLEDGFRTPTREVGRWPSTSESEVPGGLNLIWQPPDMSFDDGD